MHENRFRGSRIGASSSSRFDERMNRIRLGHLEDEAGPAGADSPWFCLRVEFGREIAVENELQRYKIETLVPMRKGRERRIRHRLVAARTEPAITGYVLVRFDYCPEVCAGLMAITHVVGLLSVDEIPIPMSHEEVMRFKAKADDGSLDWQHDSGVVYRAGDKVRIVEGPFGGFAGVVVSVRADGRGDAVVEADVFGRMTPVTLPLAILEKL